MAPEETNRALNQNYAGIGFEEPIFFVFENTFLFLNILVCDTMFTNLNWIVIDFDKLNQSVLLNLIISELSMLSKELDLHIK